MLESSDVNTEHRNAWAAPLLLLLISLVSRAFMAYRGGMSDPDSMAIAAGMARYFSSDTSFGDIILYGRQMNPGIFLVFRAVYPALFDSPAQIIPFLNLIGVASAILLPVSLYYIFRPRLGETAAAGAVLLFAFAPLVWESSLSFHPVLPASLLLSFAWLAWRRIEGTPRGAAWFAATALLATAAVITRLELLMLAPGFLLACLLSGARRRDVPLLLAVCAIAVGAHWLILRLMPGAHTTAGRSVSDYAAYISGNWLSTLRPAGMVKTCVWFVFGAGSATLAAVLAGLFGRGKDPLCRKGLAAATVMVLPTLLFWLPQPGAPILRHYFLIMPAIAWIVGACVLRGIGRRPAAVLLGAVLSINLILPETVYRLWNARRPDDAKAPHGTVFQYRDVITGQIRRYRTMQSRIEEEAGRAAAGSGAADLPPAAIVPVNWESYAYALYGMAQDGSLVKLGEDPPDQGIYLHRYRLGGAEIRLVFSNYFTWDVLPENIVPYMREAAVTGFAVIIPAEISGPAPDRMPPGTAYIRY